MSRDKHKQKQVQKIPSTVVLVLRVFFGSLNTHRDGLPSQGVNADIAKIPPQANETKLNSNL